MLKNSRHAKSSNEEWSKAGSFMRKPDRGWLHSDQAIKEGGVSYALKYLGCVEVLKSMRTLQYETRQQVTKEAMYRCCEANGYKINKRKKANKEVVKLLADHPRTTYSGRFISLTVSVTGIILTEMSTGELITKHDMQGISFASGGEKDCPDIVGYIAKDKQTRRACHVLDCPQSLSYDVINTIGQAFELRYKMFLHNPPQVLSPPKRFDAIFDEDDNDYEEPPENQENVFEEANQYDVVNDHVFNSDDDDKHEYKYPRPLNSPDCELSEYDTPDTTLNPNNHAYFELEDSKNNQAQSLEFGVGGHFNGQQISAPSYNNPLVSIGIDKDLEGAYDEPSPVFMGQQSPELAPQQQTTSQNWATFEESPSPVVANNALFSFESTDNQTFENGQNLLHNTLGYALPLPRKTDVEIERKTPPPLPKPFSKHKAELPESMQESSETPSNNELSNNVWFHGAMSRQDAENLLIRDGDFLVRESTTNPGQYVLTGQQNGYPKHLLLVDPQGVVRTRDQTFDSVGHLISYHKEQKIPIISSGSAFILKQPVAKNGVHPQYDGPCNNQRN